MTVVLWVAHRLLLGRQAALGAEECGPRQLLLVLLTGLAVLALLIAPPRA